MSGYRTAGVGGLTGCRAVDPTFSPAVGLVAERRTAVTAVPVLARSIPPFGRQVVGGWLRRLWCWSAVLLLSCIGAVPVHGQASDAMAGDETRRHGIFLDTLDVSLINVEVYVEKDGEPVLDLGPDDFEVLDDGEPMEISHFYRVGDGLKMADVGQAGGEQPAAPVERQPSTVVILLDHPFLAPATGQMIYQKIAERLPSTLELGARVMVVSKDRKVDIVQPLTTDLHAIRSALERISQKAGSNAQMEVERVIRNIQSGATEGLARSAPGGAGTGARQTSRIDARSAYQEARAHSREVYDEMRLSLDLLRSFLGSLAGLPGRKALLYVADRLPTKAGELVWRAWVQKFGFDWGTDFGVTSVDGALAEFDTSKEVRSLIADANANRVAFYPMGVGAGAGPSMMGAESRGTTVAGAGFVRFAEDDTDLQWLADKTGGRAAIGRGDVEGFFNGLESDLTDYYSLAYASPHRGDGKSHTIEVNVRRPGVIVRTLEEYRDKSSDHQMAERTLSSLLLGTKENPLAARLELGKAKRQKDGLYRLPIKVHVPMANLVMLPGETAHTGKLTLILIVHDAEGGLSEPARVRLPFEVPHGRLMAALSDSLEYPTELVIREGRQVLAVGLRDDLGDVGSTLTVEVEVGS